MSAPGDHGGPERSGGPGPKPREDLAGRTVAGKFELESFVGSGAMGDVWRARQTALDKAVAIKVLHRELALYPELTARFQREALAASRLDHPGTIRVLDFGEEPDGMLYIAMEYVEGTDLQRVVVRSYPLEERRIADILSQALSAVGAAHAEGILHRDLKPENILVHAGHDEDGRPVDVVKVCDFGIAKIVDPRSDAGGAPAPAPITATGLAVGTPEYMSPEQARGTPVDARSDVYSLGVVLYYMLTKTLPFQAETAVGVAVKHLFDEPAPPSARAPNVSPALEAVCLRAMRKKPDERYASARHMRADLQAILAGGAPAAGDEPSSGRKVAVPVVGEVPSSRRGDRDTLPAIVEGPASPPAAGVRSGSDAPVSPEPSPHSGEAGAQTPPASDIGRAPTVAVPLVREAAPPRPSPWRKLAWAVAPVALVLAFAAWKLGGPPDEPHPARQPIATASTVTTRVTSGPARPLAATASIETQGVTLLPASSHSPPPSSSPAATLVRTAVAPPTSPPREPPAPGTAAAPPEPPPPPSPPATTPPAAPSPPAPPPPDPPSVTAAPPPPPPAALDLDAAKVAVGGVSTTNGLPASSVRAALAHAGFTRCYREALRVAGAPAGGSATLRISIDDTGHVTSATAGGMGFLPGARACVEAAARAMRIANADTGEATAEVQLSFNPR